jgi:hypothetical protein
MIAATRSAPRDRFRPAIGRLRGSHERFAGVIAGRYRHWRSSAAGIDFVMRRMRSLVMVVRREGAGPITWAPRLTLVMPSARPPAPVATSGTVEATPPGAGPSAVGREILMTRVDRWQRRIEVMPPLSSGAPPAPGARAAPLSIADPAIATTARASSDAGPGRTAWSTAPQMASPPSVLPALRTRAPKSPRVDIPRDADHTPIARAPEPAPPAAPAVMSRAEIDRVTDRVMSAIDRRLNAQRERQGRGL